MAKKQQVKVEPFGSGPGIFGAYGSNVRVIGVRPGNPFVGGFTFTLDSPEQAIATVEYLREELLRDTPEANALREKNSFDNAKRFVLAVLS